MNRFKAKLWIFLSLLPVSLLICPISECGSATPQLLMSKTSPTLDSFLSVTSHPLHHSILSFLLSERSTVKVLLTFHHLFSHGSHFTSWHNYCQETWHNSSSYLHLVALQTIYSIASRVTLLTPKIISVLHSEFTNGYPFHSDKKFKDLTVILKALRDLHLCLLMTTPET